MRGSDNRAPNVIATIFAVWLVGSCVACAVFVAVDRLLGGHLGALLGCLGALVVMVGPVAYSVWWNYYRRPKPDARPWI